MVYKIKIICPYGRMKKNEEKTYSFIKIILLLYEKFIAIKYSY